MCEPISMGTALMLAVSAASAVMQYQAQSDAADKQGEAIKSEGEQRNAALSLQYKQTNEQASQQASQRAREAMIDSAKLAAIMGESGLGGVTADRNQNEVEFNKSTDLATIESNRANTIAQEYQQGKSGSAQLQGKANQIVQPSLIGTGLQVAGAYANTQTEAQRLKAYGGAAKSTATVSS